MEWRSVWGVVCVDFHLYSVLLVYDDDEIKSEPIKSETTEASHHDCRSMSSICL